MKPIIYTQRVEIIKSYQERRDCADQNIPVFLEQCGYLPIPIPNVLSDLNGLINAVNPAGILLTGGNSLVKYGGDAPERDKTESSLIQTAIEKEIPVYGFCRGMQSILDYFGCPLEPVDGHAAVRHQVHGTWGTFDVNSYHNQACRQLKAPLQKMAGTDDGVIEAIACPELKIMAAMWHPERERPFPISDIKRIQKLFG